MCTVAHIYVHGGLDFWMMSSLFEGSGSFYYNALSTSGMDDLFFKSDAV